MQASWSEQGRGGQAHERPCYSGVSLGRSMSKHVTYRKLTPFNVFEGGQGPGILRPTGTAPF